MSLFGHLALRFGSHPENLATEALTYLLKKSPAARRGFVASLGPKTPRLPDDLAFETQCSDPELGRPDLAGNDDEGHLRVLVEAKFWAGFTEHQPVGYLDQLPPGGVLVVVCPEARLGHIWRELLNRLRGANRTAADETAPGDIGYALVGERHLVLQSWKRLLNAIRLELSSEPEVLADVAQLDGLCARMDSEAFIPLTSEELTSNVYRRVHEFGQIVDDVVATLSAEGSMSTKGLRSAAANGWYGRYVRLRGAGALFHASTWKWTRLGPSPLWLTVFGASWKGDPGPAKKQLASYGIANPGAVQLDAGGNPAVMLRIPVGAERIEVIAVVAEQLRRIGEEIAPLGVGAKDAPPPPETQGPAGTAL